MDADEWIAIFDTDRWHEAANGAVAGGQIIGNTGFALDRERGDVATQGDERRPFLAPRVDERAPPRRFRRRTRIRAGEAAQNTIGRGLDRRIGGQPVALRV